MCVAIEGRVVETDGKIAVVEHMGSRVKAAAGLVDAKPGDHVRVHAGYIIQKVSRDETQTMTDLTDLLTEVGAY